MRAAFLAIVMIGLVGAASDGEAGCGFITRAMVEREEGVVRMNVWADDTTLCLGEQMIICRGGNWIEKDTCKRFSSHVREQHQAWRKERGRKSDQPTSLSGWQPKDNRENSSGNFTPKESKKINTPSSRRNKSGSSSGSNYIPLSNACK